MTGKTIAAERTYARADVFVAEALGISRSAAKKLLDEGRVTAGGAPVKAARAVSAGERFEAEIPAPRGGPHAAGYSLHGRL